MKFLGIFFDAFLLIDFVSRYYGYKYNGNKRKLLFLITVGVIFLAIAILDEVVIFNELLTLAFIGIAMIYCSIALKGAWFKKLLSCVLFLLMSINISTIIIFIFHILFRTTSKEFISDFTIYNIALIAIEKTILFYCTRIMIAMKKKTFKKLSPTVVLAMLTIPTISLITMMLIMEMGIMSNLTSKAYTYLVILVVDVLTINGITYYLFFQASKQYELKLENIKILQDIENQKKYNDIIEQNNKETRKIKHDMSNQLLHIGLCLKNNKANEAILFIEEMVGIIEAVPIIISTDDVLFNSSINIKILQAKKLGIIIKHNINIAFQNRISSTDLGILIGNIMDNAIEACSHVIKNPMIEINILEKMQGIQIEVSNSIEKSILQTNPNLETTKQDKKNNGLGIYSIKRIVEKYEGDIDIYEKENRFYINIIFL